MEVAEEIEAYAACPAMKKNWHRLRAGLDHNGWGDVSVLATKGTGYMCKCRQCGHEYISYSPAARRQFQYQINRKFAVSSMQENKFYSKDNLSS
ncbi:hypothetical protein IE989_31690 [Klebsiella pneumoniae]|nr:hypothetical protein [Klebsiella pneumoniae]